MNKLRHIGHGYLYGGLTPQELKMCKPDINKRNVRVMRWILPIILGVLIVLAIVSFIPGSGEEGNRTLYLMTAGMIAVLYIAFLVFFVKHPEKILICSYLFMIVAYCFGIFEAVYLGNETTSCVFCVFLVILPMLVIDLPIRLSVLTLVMEIFLLVTYFIVGNTLGDQYVVINSLSCTVLALFCVYSLQKTKFSDIRNHLMLEAQRDTDMMTGARSRVAYINDLGVMSSVGVKAGIAFIDVNGLKRANDTYGHEAGDRLIKDAYALMAKYFNKDGDRIYRTGGDEFIIISLGGTEEAFQQNFKTMTEIDENRDIISGGSTWLAEIRDAENAVKYAEQMMYAAKELYYEKHPEHDRRTK